MFIELILRAIELLRLLISPCLASDDRKEASSFVLCLVALISLAIRKRSGSPSRYATITSAVVVLLLLPSQRQCADIFLVSFCAAHTYLSEHISLHMIKNVRRMKRSHSDDDDDDNVEIERRQIKKGSN